VQLAAYLAAETAVLSYEIANRRPTRAGLERARR